ncbi:MAG: Uma2 family endonuclease [Pseudomonadota bacterium]|nr:Uma2 family endonuclease [Pseudomonadota bacterium]
MPASRRHHRFSLEQYLEFEFDHVEKFEFVDGEIVAMAGASPQHNVVVSNITAALHGLFAGRGRVLGSQQRIATADGLHTYPDVLVVCGKMVLVQYKSTHTLHFPSMLVEVLSPSTRDYDLGEKLERYQTIPTLQDVLLIEADRPDVRHVRRTAEGWETRRFRAIEDVIDLAGVTLPLAVIYADVPEADLG